jgi:hypothetical protein
MNTRLFIYGLAIWIAATIVLRIAGQHLLHPNNWTGTLIVFAITFPLTAMLTRRLCRSFQIPREQWPAGAVSLLIPTLFLDPFSSAFFPVVFPNMPHETAGLFGGLMLWCCAAALAAVTFGRKSV